MASFADRLDSLFELFARNRDGMSPEEAKDLFFKFRKKRVLRSENFEEPPQSEPPKRGAEGGDPAEQMMTFMRETSAKLDRIEEDIGYLKDQVDKILKKI